MDTNPSSNESLNPDNHDMYPEKRGKYQKTFAIFTIAIGLLLNIITAILVYLSFSIPQEAAASAAMGSAFALMGYLCFIAIPVGLIMILSIVIYMTVIRKNLSASALRLNMVGIILCLLPILFLVIFSNYRII